MSEFHPTYLREPGESSKSTSSRRVEVDVESMNTETNTIIRIIPSDEFGASSKPKRSSKTTEISSSYPEEASSSSKPKRSSKTGDFSSLHIDDARLDDAPSSTHRVYTKEELLEKEKKRKAEAAKVLRLLSNAELIDLVFLVDCTGSMSPWIEQIKTDIESLSRRLYDQYPSCDLRVGFVRYTDYDVPAATRTTYCDLTKNLQEFAHFVGRIKADGGADGPEDVFGGLHTALTKLNWRAEGTHVLIHIADYPCHGTRYHSPSLGDNYPDGDPAKISLDTLMENVVTKKIDYSFGHIKREQTERMIQVFNETLQSKRDYISLINSFDAQDVAMLLKHVTETVTASVTRSVAVSSGEVRPYTLVPTEPIWETIVEQNVQFFVCDLPASIEAVVLNEPLKISEKFRRLKLAKSPFAVGGQRLAYYAQETWESSSSTKVAKQFLRVGPGENSLKRYLEVLQINSISVFLAQNFNEELNKLRIPEKASNGDPLRIKTVVVKVAQFPSTTSEPTKRFFTLEPFIAGDYEKFNGNNGYVKETTGSGQHLVLLMQAFSHWTWEATHHNLIVVDIQGVVSNHRFILTDPAIHSKKLVHGKTDLGEGGMERFFKTHKCNLYCDQLGIVTKVTKTK